MEMYTIHCIEAARMEFSPACSSLRLTTPLILCFASCTTNTILPLLCVTSILLILLPPFCALVYIMFWVLWWLYCDTRRLNQRRSDQGVTRGEGGRVTRDNQNALHSIASIAPLTIHHQQIVKHTFVKTWRKFGEFVHRRKSMRNIAQFHQHHILDNKQIS